MLASIIGVSLPDREVLAVQVAARLSLVPPAGPAEVVPLARTSASGLCCGRFPGMSRLLCRVLWKDAGCILQE
jgi:hypothetical protein